MKRSCQITGEEFEILPRELEVIKIMKLSLPVYSPKVREIMRLAFRNERNLFIRKCDATGEQILSVYHANKPFPVYKYDFWMSDKWDPPALDYDFNKSFFEQYAALSAITPRVNLFAPYNENCDYVNAAEKNKNCYMHILSDRSEDCYYTHGIFACKDCIDSAYIINSELCYEATDCRNCYHLRMCFLCDNCSDLSFCFDCRGSRNSFFCAGLRNQEYCFFNKQLSREEYEKKIKEIYLGSHKVFEEYKNKFIREIVEMGNYTRMINTENSDGNFLINTKNCHHCYDVEDAEDCSFLRIGSNHLKDVHHSHAIVDGGELIYSIVSSTESYNCHNMVGCWTTKESFYSEFLQGCKNCIGCISLRYKKNCILNKQYSEAEFKKIKEHIIAELGDYYGSPFPLKLAPFTYQDSTYRDYGDLTKEEVEAVGWRYGEETENLKSEETKPLKSGETESSQSPSDDIENFTPKDNQIFKCEISGKPFKIIPSEYKLLRKIGAPLPCKHFEVRFQERAKFRKQAAKGF